MQQTTQGHTLASVLPRNAIPQQNGVPYIHTAPRRNSMTKETWPTLVYINEDNKEQVFTLNKPFMKIGRREENDLVFLCQNISKHHANIEQKDGRVILTDNNSANGTTVNGLEIDEPYTLQDGDVVELGTIILTFKPAQLFHNVSSPSPISAGIYPSVSGFVNRNTMALKRGSRGWRSTLVQPITSPGRLQRNNIDMVTILPSEKKYEENVHVREELSGEADDFLPESQITDDTALRSDYEKLRLAYDLSKIGLTDNLDALCHHMLDIMFQTLKAQRAVILLLDRDTNSLVKYLSRTKDGQDEEKEILLSYTILQDVFKNKKCLITADALQDPVLGKAASIAANQFRAAMCVPLIAHNKVHGVLHLDSPQIHAFTTKDMALCRAIGNQTAIAIENANLLSDIENEVRIRETLGRFLPPHVIEKSVEKGEEGDLIKKGGRNMVGTILFADIRDFTTFSESNTPQEVVNTLNDFFERLTNIIFAHNGIIDKFIGDALMAVFGTLEDELDPEYDCVAAALEFKETIRIMNANRAEKGKQAILLGVGINTGPLTAGFIGSARRMEYTCIGDTVNTSSRICGKAEPEEVLISEQTWLKVKDRIHCEYVGLKQFKGKTTETAVYRALSLKE